MKMRAKPPEMTKIQRERETGGGLNTVTRLEEDRKEGERQALRGRKEGGNDVQGGQVNDRDERKENRCKYRGRGIEGWRQMGKRE